MHQRVRGDHPVERLPPRVAGAGDDRRIGVRRRSVEGEHRDRAEECVEACAPRRRVSGIAMDAPSAPRSEACSAAAPWSSAPSTYDSVSTPTGRRSTNALIPTRGALLGAINSPTALSIVAGAQLGKQRHQRTRVDRLHHVVIEPGFP